jgi:cation transport ATPase
MSNIQPPEPPQTPPTSGPAGPRPMQSPPGWSPAARVAILTDHFAANARSHTPEALGRAALEAGYTQEDVTAAIAAADARLTAAEASAPTRRLAQRTILAAYVVTYLLFAMVFLSQRFSYGIGPIALVILTVVMLVALGVSALWARRGTWSERGGSLDVGAILSVPIILLVLVAGTCAVTTFPSMGRY